MSSQSEIAGEENRRKVLGSTIFGDEPYGNTKQTKYQQKQDINRNQNSDPSLNSNLKHNIYATESHNYQHHLPVLQNKAAMSNVPKVDVLLPPKQLPSMQALPEFSFDNSKLSSTFDLNMKPKMRSIRSFTPSKLPLNSLNEIRKIRECLQHDFVNINDRLRKINVDNLTKMQQMNFNVPNLNFGMSLQQNHINQLQQMIDQIPPSPGPSFSTHSEFVLPDGKPFD